MCQCVMSITDDEIRKRIPKRENQRKGIEICKQCSSFNQSSGLISAKICQ